VVSIVAEAGGAGGPVAADPLPHEPAPTTIATPAAATGRSAPSALRRYGWPIEYEGAARGVSVGVVVPFDFALDWEYWKYLPADVTLHFTRTPHHRRDAGMYLARATGRPSVVARSARTLLAVDPAAVLYACTSGSFIRGLAGERALCTAMRGAGLRHAVTTSGAAATALRLSGVRSVAVATPYSGNLTRHLVAYLEEAGFDVASAHYLGLHRGIGAVSQATIIDLVRQAARGGGDAVFVSCTSLRTHGTVAQLEGELGKPVFTANQVSLWAVLVAAGMLPRSRRGPEPDWVLGDADPVALSTRLLMDAAAEAAAVVG
jgi:maleate isomerase